MPPETNSRLADDPPALLGKAAIRAARLLGMRNVDLAQVLGISEATISKIDRHGTALPNDPKKLEIAALFVRLYRSLDAIVGGDDAVASEWLRNDNTALGRPPIEAIRTVTGLVDVVAYLDARRAVL